MGDTLSGEKFGVLAMVDPHRIDALHPHDGPQERLPDLANMHRLVGRCRSDRAPHGTGRECHPLEILFPLENDRDVVVRHVEHLEFDQAPRLRGLSSFAAYSCGG
ncbi:hypothetical protein D3C71_1789400 [compost metagenome]